MPDLVFCTFGAIPLARFLGEICTNVLGGEAHQQIHKIFGRLGDKLRNGQLPANHDLRLASREALQEATRALA